MEELEALEKPGTYNFCVTRNDSIRKTFTVQDSSNTRVSLTGLSGTATVRDAPDGNILSVTLTVSVDQSIAGQATTGDVIVSAPGDETDADIAGVWELVLDDGTPTGVFRKTLIAGSFTTVRR